MAVDNPNPTKSDKPRRKSRSPNNSSIQPTHISDNNVSSSPANSLDSPSFSELTGQAINGTANFLLSPLESLSQIQYLDFSFVLRGVSTLTSNLILRSFNLRHTIFNVLRRSIGFQRLGISGPIQKEPFKFNSIEEDAEKIEIDDDSENKSLLPEINAASEEASRILSQNFVYSIEFEEIEKSKINISSSLDKLNLGNINCEKMLIEFSEQIAELERRREDMASTSLIIKSAKAKAQSYLDNLEKRSKECNKIIDISDTTLNEEFTPASFENKDVLKDSLPPVNEFIELPTDQPSKPSEDMLIQEPIEKPTEDQSSKPSENISEEILVQEPNDSLTEDCREEEIEVISVIEPEISKPAFLSSQEWQAYDCTVTSLYKDPNGPFLTSSSSNGEISFWKVDPLTGEYKLSSSLDSKQGSIHCLKIIDGILATGGQDNKICIWNTRSLFSSISEPNMLKVDSFDVQPDSPLLSPISEPFVANRSISPTSELESSALNPAIILKGHTGLVRCLDMDDRHVVSGSHDGSIRQWDIENGKLVSSLDLSWFMNKDAEKSYKVQYWDTLSGRGSHVEALGSSVGALQFHGRALCSGSADGIIRLWDLRSGQMHHSLAGHTGPITCLQLSSSLVVSGSLDHSVKIWDLRTRKCVEQFKYPGGVIATQFDSQRVVVSCETKQLHLYEFMTFQSRQLLGYENPSWSLYLDSDNHLISGDQRGKIRLTTL